MIIKLLGALDIISATALVFNDSFPFVILLFLSAYLIIKGGFFGLQGDAMSFGDIFSGFVLLFLAFGVSNPILRTACIIFLVIKGTMSLI